MKNRIQIKEIKEKVGEEVILSGWIHNRRDHGKLIFLDLRDATGIVQMVALPNHKEAHQKANELRSEWVIKVKGKINERPEKMVNEEDEFGYLEVEILDIQIISKAETPPFEIDKDTRDIDEATRLKYRYLDLRTERLQKNMKIRSQFVRSCRNYLFDKGFNEIETPTLTKSTPEGSRDFVVPSRHNVGKFYALPQSPQQYKQLLMAAGFERYFQLAKALRDEDLRADRGFEHTQLDIEMSFIDQERMLNLIEGMITETVENLGFAIKEKPFPRFTYDEAIEQFGEDKFDLRSEDEKESGVLAYAWVVDFPFFEKTDEGNWTFSHNPFSMPKEENMEDHMSGNNIENIKTQQYDLVCNGFESGGGSIRTHDPEVLKATYKIMGYSDDEIEESVGHMLKAFSYGMPPHGGIALGIERNIMNLTGEKYLREVQAFPMTRGGQTSVMNAPNELAPEQLKELGLEIKKKDQE